MTRVLSGIQPTGQGIPHLGNYLGAIKGYVRLQETAEAFYCVADQHATTVPYNPKTLKSQSIATAAALLGAGVDPGKAVLFRQSAVHGHSLLANVMGHVATLGPLERMTQFKEKGRDAEGDQRASIGLGLLTYPVLMASDILLYHADYVPVGEDQHQHLQYTAALAKRFNSLYKPHYFRAPRKIIQDGAARVMSLRNPLKKMSKSDENQDSVVYITDSLDVAARKFRQAVTDSELRVLPSDLDALSDRVGLLNLVRLLAAMRDVPAEEALAGLAGHGFKHLKDALTEAFECFIAPIGQRTKVLMDDPSHVQSVLEKGGVKASSVADVTIREVYDLVGY